MTQSDQISVGYPTRLFTSLEEGRVDPFRLRQIDVDYRALVLADRDNAESFLAARSYLAQVEIGAAALRLSEQSLAAEGVTHEYLQSMRETSESGHKAVVREMQRMHIGLDQRLLDVSSAVFEGSAQVASSLDHMTETLSLAEMVAAEYVAEAIFDVGNLLHADLGALAELAHRQVSVLREIHRTMLHPMDTRVREMHKEALRLLKQGFTGKHGKWRYDNWREALKLLHQVLADPIGSTNPQVSFDCAYLEWKCSVSSRNQQEKLRGLLESRKQFDRAARLSDGENNMLHLRSLRHLAHVQYLLGEYKAAKGSLKKTGRIERDADVALEYARYSMAAGVKGEALHALEIAIELRPTMALAMFAEPDFKELHSEMVALLHSKMRQIKTRVAERVDALPSKIANSIAPRHFGSVQGHKELRRVADSISSKNDFLSVVQGEQAQKRLLLQIEAMPTSHLEAVLILLYYNMTDTAMNRLSELVKEDPRIICEFEENKNLILTPALVKQVNEERIAKAKQLTALVSLVRNFTTSACEVFHHAGLNVEVVSAIAPLLAFSSEKIQYFSYTELCRQFDLLSGLWETFVTQFVKDWVANNKHSASSLFLFHQKKPGELPSSVAAYVDISLSILICQAVHGRATDDMILLESVRMARVRYTRHSKEAALTKVEENGCGEYWRFSFPLLYGREAGKTISLLFFVPFKEVRLFRKPQGFTVGNALEYTMLRHSLSEQVSGKMKEAVLTTSLDPL